MLKRFIVAFMLALLVGVTVVSPAQAKTASGHYSFAASECTMFKASGRKLYVRVKKGKAIKFSKNNSYKKLKKVGTYKKFALSKKCKYYTASVADGKKLYDTKDTKLVKYAKVKVVVNNMKKSKTSDCGVVVVVNKGYVTKVVTVIS